MVQYLQTNYKLDLLTGDYIPNGINTFNMFLSSDGGKICLDYNGTFKKIRVIDNPDFVWKLNKNSISARGGASGLLEFFQNCINEGFCESYITKTFSHFFGR